MFKLFLIFCFLSTASYSIARVSMSPVMEGSGKNDYFDCSHFIYRSSANPLGALNKDISIPSDGSVMVSGGRIEGARPRGASTRYHVTFEKPPSVWQKRGAAPARPVKPKQYDLYMFQNSTSKDLERITVFTDSNPEKIRSIKFNIVKGQCVPKRFSIGGRTIFDLDLCKKIRIFLDEHKEDVENCRACDNRLGRGISGIFKDYGPQFRKSGVSGQSDEVVGESLGKIINRYSPVIAGHRIDQNCSTYGLDTFIANSALWERPAVSAPAAPQTGGGTLDDKKEI